MTSRNPKITESKKNKKCKITKDTKTKNKKLNRVQPKAKVQTSNDVSNRNIKPRTNTRNKPDDLTETRGAQRLYTPGLIDKQDTGEQRKRRK